MNLRRLSLTCLWCLAAVLAGAAVGMAQPYTEAPMLAELVAQGELPPLEERLPLEPFVIGPGTLIPEEDLDWQPGTYGGTLRGVHGVANWNSEFFSFVRVPLLRAPGLTVDNVQGFAVKDFAASDDNTVFTFYMREGLRWSDGEPVTTEDVRFAVDDVMGNPQLTPSFPAKYRSGGTVEGTPLELHIMDDYTFEIRFDEPYGSFITQIAIAGWAGFQELLKPSHFLKQFHIDFTSLDEMRPYLDAEELDDEWDQLFGLRDVGHFQATGEAAIGVPTLSPWYRVPGPEGRMVFERNPYYFVVDTEGRQLPYIDRLESEYVADPEMAHMKAIIGELDLLSSLARMPKIPLYINNEEIGGYTTVLGTDTHTTPTFYLNLTYDDPTWREVVRDVRFRKALSIAMDRSELIESLYFETADRPRTVPSYYDLDEARNLLDAMGMNHLDAEGYRLAPNGEEFELFLEVDDSRLDYVPMAEMLVEYFNELNLRASMRVISSVLRGQRANANELMATIQYNHQPVWDSG